MSQPASPPSALRDGRVRITFAAGGWVLLLSAVLCAVVLFWALAGPILGLKRHGDGKNAETYGFDLSTCLVPREGLHGSGRPRDFLLPLDFPSVLNGSDIDGLNERLRATEHLKYIVPGDRVVGVIVDGVPRAYPLLVLNRHEIVNDELGGVPIAVTFSPLCDSPVVVDRRVDGRTLTFGVSGLLYNSNLVMYDRLEGAGDHEPSLWCQLQARAIAGPAAARGETLRVIPHINLTTWGDWLARHPQTTVIDADPLRRRQYREISYERYLDSAELLSPVIPPPTAENELSPKSRVVVLCAGAQERVLSLDQLLAALESTPNVDESIAGSTVRFTRAAQPAGANRGHVHIDVMTPAGDSPAVEIYPCLWFAWQRVRHAGTAAP